MIGNLFIGLCVLTIVGALFYIIGSAAYEYPLVFAAFASLAFLIFLIQRVLS